MHMLVILNGDLNQVWVGIGLLILLSIVKYMQLQKVNGKGKLRMPLHYCHKKIICIFFIYQYQIE